MKLGELSLEERLIAGQAVLNLRSLNKACDAAADGAVLAVAEQLAMTQGRELIRRTLQVLLDEQARTAQWSDCTQTEHTSEKFLNVRREPDTLRAHFSGSAQMTLSKSSSLLHLISERLRWLSLGKRFYISFLIVAALYGALLLISRLLGLIPNWFDPYSLLAIPVLAGGVSVLRSQNATRADAAREIDRHSGTKDLYLTVAMLENSPGDFKPLVAREAEKRAACIKPANVLPLYSRRVRNRFNFSLLIAALLLLGVLYLPQLDPLGNVAQAELIVEKERKFEETKRATLLRAAQLKRDKAESKQAKEVEKAIEKLKSTFNNMQPNNKKKNFEKLADQQKLVGEKWRRLKAKNLQDLLSRKPISQQFGGSNEHQDQLRKWTKDLQQGSTESLQEEIKDLQKQLQRLTKTADAAERAKMMQKIRRRLEDLADFSNERVKSPALSAALERAMEQMEMAKSEGLSTDAMKALAETLDLSKAELEEIAQSAKDLKDLEQALKTLQMAKSANGKESLDGKAAEGCKSMSDYEAMYKKMMAEGQGDGPGMGGEGIGKGNKAPEDDSQVTDFKSERSKSAITAGKVLLTLKTRGLGERGEAKLNYKNAVRDIRQGVSEAILQEQIPPGYHKGIKKYFDSIDDSADKPNAKK